MPDHVFDMIDKNYQEYHKKYNQLISGVDYAVVKPAKVMDDVSLRPLVELK